ncbi:MAG: mannose-1-phosphate guanylyltransferase [Firmicutes bacterium]|nr:mannose-1-phosphate guanylyltransferase [Bacillota bacterium]
MEQALEPAVGDNVVGLILAGGQGKRLWPKSTPERPKQFLRLTGGDHSLLQATFHRLRQLLPPDRIWVVTQATYAAEVRDQLPSLPPGHVILEPAPRGTAAAAGLACVMAGWEAGNPVQLIVPADHQVKDESQFARTLLEASLVADQDLMVTVGVPPTRPETAYGYLKLGERLSGWPFPVYRVQRFREKPSPPTARRIYQDGRHLWNAGIFAWKVSVFLTQVALYLPEHARILRQLTGTPASSRSEAVQSLYPLLPAISIDHGLLERTRTGLAVVPARFEWADLGSWPSLERTSPPDAGGNRCRGNALLRDCSGCLVDWEGREAIIVGVRNLIIAGDGGRLLVCARRHSHLLADLVQELERHRGEQASAVRGDQPCAS